MIMVEDPALRNLSFGSVWRVGKPSHSSIGPWFFSCFLWDLYFLSVKSDLPESIRNFAAGSGFPLPGPLEHYCRLCGQQTLWFCCAVWGWKGSAFCAWQRMRYGLGKIVWAVSSHYVFLRISISATVNQHWGLRSVQHLLLRLLFACCQVSHSLMQISYLRKWITWVKPFWKE